MLTTEHPEFDLEPAVATAQRAGESRDQTLVRLHQERYECVTAVDGLRHFSRSWLELRGYGRLEGLCWPHGCTLPRAEA